LFSLSGVLPLGAFFVVHVVANARALRGDHAFMAATRAFHRIPALGLVEAVFVFLPLAFHAAFGLWLTVARRPFAQPSPYPAGVRIAVRVTGVLTLAFLAMHLPELRFRTSGYRLGGGELLTALDGDLSSTWHGIPWRGAAYLCGAGCATFHFAAGLWSFVVTTWLGPDTRGQRLRRVVAWAATALGVSLWLVLTDVVVLHATGARLVGAPDPAPVSTEPCPAPSP
jgi:succinate dehydrogenase / fumarate reductase cytochrome b subunit